jgi:hypothetical protein
VRDGFFNRKVEMAAATPKGLIPTFMLLDLLLAEIPRLIEIEQSSKFGDPSRVIPAVRNPTSAETPAVTFVGRPPAFAPTLNPSIPAWYSVETAPVFTVTLVSLFNKSASPVVFEEEADKLNIGLFGTNGTSLSFVVVVEVEEEDGTGAGEFGFRPKSRI